MQEMFLWKPQLQNKKKTDFYDEMFGSPKAKHNSKISKINFVSYVNPIADF